MWEPGEQRGGGCLGRAQPRLKERSGFPMYFEGRADELADRLDWVEGDRLELVCLHLGPVLF